MPFDTPIEIKCDANRTAWTRAKRLVVQGEVVMKNAKLWFSTGCSDHVRIRIKRQESVFLPNYSSILKEDPPDPAGFGPSYQGDNVEYAIEFRSVFYKSEKIDIEYINADPSNSHLVIFRPLFVLKDPNQAIDTESTGTGRRPRDRAEEETSMIEVGNGYGAQQSSEQAPRGDRGAFPPIAKEGERAGHNRDDDPRAKIKYRPRYE